MATSADGVSWSWPTSLGAEAGRYLLDRVPSDVRVERLHNDPRLARYLPGKLYEYVAAGPPLLVFGEGGEVGALVERFGLGVIVPAGVPDMLEAALDAMLTAGPKIDRSPAVAEWLAAHARRRLADDLFDALEELSSRRR
jgi:hypothetical protein